MKAQMKTGSEDFSQYDIFISYKRDTNPDSDYSRVAEELQKLFEDRLAIPTFIDKKRILTGDDFEDKIRAAVKGVKVVICLLSDRFMDSTFCVFEMSHAINQDKFFPFSVQPDFDPSSWKTIGRTNVPSLTGWRGEVRDSMMYDHLDAIFAKLDRPALKALCDVIESRDDAKVLDWCSRYDFDPACQHQRQSYVERRLNKNEENSRRRTSYFLDASEEMAKRLAAERSLIGAIQSEIASASGVTHDHIRKLREIEEVDLTESANAIKLRVESERNRLKADVEEFKSEIERLKGDVAEEKARYRLLERELDGNRTPGHDEIDGLLQRLPHPPSETLAQHIRQAHRFKSDAKELQAEAEDLKVRIASMVKLRTAEPKQKASDGSQISFHRNPPGSDYSFSGCLEFPKGKLNGPVKVWGTFNEFGKFRGIGVIEYKLSGRNAGTYFGPIDGVEPKPLQYGVFEFTLTTNSQVKKWEGSVGPEAKGRLEYVGGNTYWGQVHNSSFGTFDPHGYGFMEPRDVRSKDGRLRKAGQWENGHYIAEA